MSAVIQAADQFEAVRLAGIRIRKERYGAFARHQFTRRAASLVRRGMPPREAAERAVPHKSARNGEPLGVA